MEISSLRSPVWMPPPERRHAVERRARQAATLTRGSPKDRRSNRRSEAARRGSCDTSMRSGRSGVPGGSALVSPLLVLVAPARRRDDAEGRLSIVALWVAEAVH